MPHLGTESLPCSDPANILASVLPSPSTDCSVQANSIMPWWPNYFMIFPLLSLTVNFWMYISSRIQALLPLSKTYSCQIYHLFLAPQAQMLFPFVRHPHCYYRHFFFQRKSNVYIYQTFLKIHRKVKKPPIAPIIQVQPLWIFWTILSSHFLTHGNLFIGLTVSISVNAPWGLGVPYS